MKTNAINVLGYTGNSRQLVVKTLNTDLRISQNAKFPELDGPNPYEYILAGFAGCINALGQIVAAELGIVLKSLQIEITGNFNQNAAVNRRPGFEKVTITLKPSATAPLHLLQKWLIEVQQRSPVYDNMINNTPVELSLYKEFTALRQPA